MKIIKGGTLEEQMKSVDVILDRFSRRLHKTARAIVTPYPISSYVDTPIEDIVLKYMFPTNGTLKAGYMFVEKMPKSGVDLLIDIGIGELHRSEQTFTKKSPITIQPNISISAGSRLTVKVIPKEEEVSGIWIAFLWAPDVKNVVVKEFLIDELNKISGNNIG